MLQLYVKGRTESRDAVEVEHRFNLESYHRVIAPLCVVLLNYLAGFFRVMSSFFQKLLDRQIRICSTDLL